MNEKTERTNITGERNKSKYANKHIYSSLLVTLLVRFDKILYHIFQTKPMMIIIKTIKKGIKEDTLIQNTRRIVYKEPEGAKSKDNSEEEKNIVLKIAPVKIHEISNRRAVILKNDRKNSLGLLKKGSYKCLIW